MDERERVHELERERRRERVLDRAARRLGRREAEHRPDPLAAAAERVAHRLLEPPELGWQLELASEASTSRGARQAPASAACRARCTSASISFASSAISASPSTALVEVAARVGARLERVDARPQPLEQLLGALQRLVRAHARLPLATRPRIPLTSRAASSVA